MFVILFDSEVGNDDSGILELSDRSSEAQNSQCILNGFCSRNIIGAQGFQEAQRTPPLSHVA